MISKADGVQCVFFPRQGVETQNASDLWGKLFPDFEFDAYQRASANPNLLTSASGSNEDFEISLLSQVGRIQINLVLRTDNVVLSNREPPRIQDVPKAAEFAAECLRKLCDHYEAQRVAIILDLGETVIQGQEASRLMEELPHLGLSPESTDILIQFNIPKPFGFDNSYTINRLCTWSSGQVGFARNGPPGIGNPIVMTPYIGLKLDINSKNDRSLFDVDPKVAIEEIKEEALSIYAQGVNRLI